MIPKKPLYNDRAVGEYRTILQSRERTFGEVRFGNAHNPAVAPHAF
jgi:hypothetical protein